MRVPRHQPTALLFLLAAACLTAAAQSELSSIRSAKIESIVPVPDKNIIQITLKNIGERPITAYTMNFFMLDAAGARIPCGGRGIDMIDSSDPMPNRNIYVHGRRNWVAPNATATMDAYPRCSGKPVSLDSIRAELGSISFENASGEGDAHQLEYNFSGRREARNERVKWMARFTALRDAPDLKTAAQSLYQDLVDAARSAEINPEDAMKQGMAKPVREELQELALAITQLAVRNQPLGKNEFLEWRITDLEQRTARLIRGSE